MSVWRWNPIKRQFSDSLSISVFKILEKLFRHSSLFVGTSFVLFYVAFVNFSLFVFFEENSVNRLTFSQSRFRKTIPRIDKKALNFGIVESSREKQPKVKFKVKFKMAMLTDDEYKDFEAQIKLQEKVIIRFSRIFQNYDWTTGYQCIKLGSSGPMVI